jgi:hypothetical protein
VTELSTASGFPSAISGIVTLSAAVRADAAADSNMKSGKAMRWRVERMPRVPGGGQFEKTGAETEPPASCLRLIWLTSLSRLSHSRRAVIGRSAMLRK